MKQRLAVWSFVALLVAAARAQEMRTLEVHVTSVSGRDVYIDMGRAAGIQPGTLVKLYPPGVNDLEATVRAASSTSARAELPIGIAPPPVGTRGEVQVPKVTANDTAPAPAPPTKPVAPDHPPWQRQLDPSNPDEPLLVATYGQKPDERPFTLDGRVYGSLDWNSDTGGARNDQYFLGRLGVRAEGHNALGYGERTLFAGEIDDRHAILEARPDTDEVQGRIDLLSTAFGTEHWAPVGVEIGRFLSQALPEIGLVDGAEAVLRYNNGIRLGGGIGAYPLPYPGRASGDDVGVHAFFDYVRDQKRSFAATVGLQKTWHTGAPDRDLLLLRVEDRPIDDVWLFGSAKIDYYTSGDTRKSSGFQVTEFFGQARWDKQKVGAGVAFSHFSWPDLKRTEYKNLPDELVRNGKVDRVSPSIWVRPVTDLRLTARTDIWKDQDNSGTSFELGADWMNALKSEIDLSAQVFRSEGGFQSGPGMRLLARRRVGEVYLNAGYRWYDYQISGLLTGTESYTRQTIEAGASWSIGNADMDLNIEHSFGSQENAYAIGLYLQWRF